MANNHRCGGCGRRDTNNSYGCLNSLSRCGCPQNYPYYRGPCPDADGCYDFGFEVRDGGAARRGDRSEGFGIFSAMLPMAVAANGIVPLVSGGCMGGAGSFPVNSGLITIDEEGTYLATYTVRVPEGATVDSTFTLNVNDASQSSAIAETGGEGPACFTAQAIFDVCDRATLTLRSSEAINVPDTSTQPMVTLSLVRI